MTATAAGTAARAVATPARWHDRALVTIKCNPRAVYRTLELPGKHSLKAPNAAVDATGVAAYGFDPKKDLLEQLLRLNLEVAARIAGKQPVTPPGVPAAYGDPAPLVTDDCTRP